MKQLFLKLEIEADILTIILDWIIFEGHKFSWKCSKFIAFDALETRPVRLSNEE